MLAVGAGGGCLDIFSVIYHLSFLSPSLWETARYRLKYCLKGPLSLKQPTNQNFFRKGELVGWLVGLLWAKRPFETVFQSISDRLSERGRKKRETIDERKNVQTPPPAPSASAVGPCPTLIQISRTPWHWKFTQNHRITRPSQRKGE